MAVALVFVKQWKALAAVGSFTFAHKFDSSTQHGLWEQSFILTYLAKNS